MPGGRTQWTHCVGQMVRSQSCLCQTALPLLNAWAWPTIWGIVVTAATDISRHAAFGSSLNSLVTTVQVEADGIRGVNVSMPCCAPEGPSVPSARSARACKHDAVWEALLRAQSPCLSCPQRLFEGRCCLDPPLPVSPRKLRWSGWPEGTRLQVGTSEPQAGPTGARPSAGSGSFSPYDSPMT